ncbi:MAG: hypothetical protein PHS02_04275 [Candidatus ainarchaeum sp.]|nr:hypothetical protein [Candidatus ainarchaeum sp.]
MKGKEQKLNPLQGKLSADHLLLIAATLIMLYLNYSLLSSMKQLPSPIYGEDYWNHLGTIYHLFYGGAIFENGQMQGEIPWVPWSYHLIVSTFSKLFSLEPMQGVFLSNLMFIPITCYLLYRISSRFTKNIFVIIAAMLPLLIRYPIYKYTDFAQVLVMPLLILAWFKYRENPSRNNIVILALAMAFASLTNVQSLISSYMVFGTFFLADFIPILQKNTSLSAVSSPESINSIKTYLILFFISFILALPYWFFPIFVYMGHTPNDLFIYGWADYTKFDEQFGSIYNGLSAFILPDLSLSGLVRVLTIAGILLVIKMRNNNKDFHSAFVLLMASFVALLHLLVTFNLFHVHFGAEAVYSQIQITLAVVEFAVLGEFLRSKWSLVPFVLLILSAASFSEAWVQRDASQYYQTSKETLPQPMLDLQSWIDSNSGVHDVFLTDNEDAFMMNGLTGRKSVSFRRTHAPLYTDMNQRALDSAVILYGNNDSLRMALIRKYNVSYVLWTYRWFDNQYTFNQDGKLTGFFDPFMVPYKQEYEDYLKSNGVPYTVSYSRLDPAWLPNYPIYKVIVALPARNSQLKPWSEGFDAHIQEVKSVDLGANAPVPFAVIYKVMK